MRSGRLAFSGLEEFAVPLPEHRSHHPQHSYEARISQALEQGFQRGYAAGAAQALADADLRAESLHAEFEAMISAERRAWQQQTGDKLCDALQTGIQLISYALEGRVAALLRPWLKDRLLDRAVRAFHDAVDRAIFDGMAVEICGSEELVVAIRARLGGNAKVVKTTINDDPSLVVKCQDTVLTANFSDWSSQLEVVSNE